MWILLEPDDVVQEGDETRFDDGLLFSGDRWTPVCLGEIGKICGANGVFRRKLPAQASFVLLDPGAEVLAGDEYWSCDLGLWDLIGEGNIHWWGPEHRVPVNGRPVRRRITVSQTR